MQELEKIQKSFLWKNSAPKIKHETNCKDYKSDGLKNVDVSYKIVNLHRSWMRKLCSDCFQEWKSIPLHLITMLFASKFRFYSNIYFKKISLKNL